MTSVERLLDFKDLPQEADTIVEDYRPPENWPSEGSIEIRNLRMRYRPELDLVLKGVNLSIPGGTKVQQTACKQHPFIRKVGSPY